MPTTRRNPLRIDPTRTVTLRRQAATRIKRLFAKLRLYVHHLVVTEDAFGLLVVNQFCPTGEGGGVDPSCGVDTQSSTTFLLDRLKSIGGSIHTAEHFVKDKIANAVSKLPEPYQTATLKAWAGAVAVKEVAFAAWTANQALAEKVAEERGATPEEARRFRGVLSGVDLGSFKVVAVGAPMLLGPVIGGAVSSATWVVPPATGAYLAYSTARDPMATVRAAKKLVKESVHGVGVKVGTIGSMAFNSEADNINTVADALERHNYDDWYIALLSVAIDELKDVRDAIQLANGLNVTENAFCPTGPGGGVDPTCSPNHVEFVDIFTRSSALTPKILTAETREELKKTVTESTYELFRGMGLTSHRVTKEEAAIIQQLKPGDEAPQFLTERKIYGDKAATRHAFSSYTKSEAVAKRYKEGTVEIILKGVVPAEQVVADLSKLKSVSGHSADVIKYAKKEKEVVVEGTPKMYIHSIKGEKKIRGFFTGTVATTNTRFQFNSPPEKVKAFQAWLKQQIAATVTSATEEQLWQRYTEAGYKKGQGRAFDDVRKKGITETADFYKGTREEFLRSSFSSPVAIDKVKLLAGRSFDDLENITTDMSTKMSRTLTDGLVQGKSPRDVARDLDEDVDIGKERALLVARTEIIRVHAEGQLDALEKLGVEEVGVAVEWSTTGDEKVCKLCEPLEGVVLKIDEARGMLPRHPNCRCAWLPAGLGEDTDDQKTTKKEIDDALSDSGLDERVDKDRPEPIINILDQFSKYILNAFCPTGEGGGVDPTCSPGSARHVLDTIVGRKAKKVSAADAKKLVTALSNMTGKELNALKKESGVKASGKKAVLVKKLADALRAKIERDKSAAKSTTAPKSTTPKIVAPKLTAPVKAGLADRVIGAAASLPPSAVKFLDEHGVKFRGGTPKELGIVVGAGFSGHYNPGTNEVNVSTNTRTESITKHEAGHAIDYNIGRDMKLAGGRPFGGRRTPTAGEQLSHYGMGTTDKQNHPDSFAAAVAKDLGKLPPDLAAKYRYYTTGKDGDHGTDTRGRAQEEMFAQHYALLTSKEFEYDKKEYANAFPSGVEWMKKQLGPRGLI